MKVKFVGLSDVELEVNHLTVLTGTGEFQDNNGEIFQMESIIIPMLGDGKHITVQSKEVEDTLEYRSYDDGKILSFRSQELAHWKV
jgi:hypothetical protein